jgi:hypothetical protein
MELNNHDGIILIVCMVFNLLFISFFVSYIINCIFYVIFCNYDNIMWDLYAQRARGSKCESTL